MLIILIMANGATMIQASHNHNHPNFLTMQQVYIKALGKRQQEWPIKSNIDKNEVANITLEEELKRK